jgi:archaemetzincin
MAEADGEAVAAIRRKLESETVAPAREICLPPADFAYDPGRGQYGSAPVLELLLRICPADALRLLAVTERDLFIPALTFVYGQAQLGGRVAVVSLARLRQEFYGLPPDREAFLRRALKEALHETGHLFGLRHCENAGCAMRLATNIRQIDLKSADFCALCAARFRRREGVTQ